MDAYSEAPFWPLPEPRHRNVRINLLALKDYFLIGESVNKKPPAKRLFSRGLAYRKRIYGGDVTFALRLI